MNHQKPTKDKDQKPVVTDESLVPADAPISTPKHHVKLKTQNPKNKWLIAALVLALVLLIAAIPLYIYAIRNNLKEVSDTTGPTAEQVQNQDKSLCFVRLAHLVCTDISGRNYVRYDLPKLSDGAEIESLSASADQSKYVAYTTSSSSNLRVVVLDKNLKIIKELTMPSGLTPNAPIMAADGKSILLELAGSTEYSIGRHIYRYDIATGKYTKLTTSGYNSQPQETRSGRIIYSYFGDDGTGWMAKIMNGDGTQQINIPLYGLDNKYDFSYSYALDSISAWGTNGSGNDVVAYGGLTFALAGNTLKFINTQDTIAKSNGIDGIFVVDSTKLLLSSYIQAEIINIADGSSVTKIDKTGKTVGLINTANFNKSAQQTESPYERIRGLDSAPADFQIFIKAEFDVDNLECEKSSKGGAELNMSIGKVVRGRFASVSQGCQGGFEGYYIKNTNGVWTFAFGSQGMENCETINEYKFTKEIIPVCYSNTLKKEQNNTNP